jgi:hypothetical protein
MTLAELEFQERGLWEALKQVEKPYEEARDRWATVHRQLERERLRAEILAEQAEPEIEADLIPAGVRIAGSEIDLAKVPSEADLRDNPCPDLSDLSQQDLDKLVPF